MAQYIDGISCAEENPLFIQAQRAKNNELPIIDVITALETLIKQDENSDKELNSEIHCSESLRIIKS